jgi:uncharacterized protein YaaR (DUF327 family)
MLKLVTKGMVIIDLSSLKNLKIEMPKTPSPNFSSLIETERRMKEIFEVQRRAAQEEINRKKKLLEETETTRQLLEEFKIIVQEFIVASEAQTKATEHNSRIMKEWTTRIGWLTIVMAIFAATTLYLTYIGLRQ